MADLLVRSSALLILRSRSGAGLAVLIALSCLFTGHQRHSSRRRKENDERIGKHRTKTD